MLGQFSPASAMRYQLISASDAEQAMKLLDFEKDGKFGLADTISDPRSALRGWALGRRAGLAAFCGRPSGARWV